MRAVLLLPGARSLMFIVCAMGVCVSGVLAEGPDPRMKGAYRLPANNGWIFVHLEGTPSEIGYQHGNLLASEIAEDRSIAALELGHSTRKAWEFFRTQARTMMWPHIEQEYRDELQGIADGAASKGEKLDLWDVVALNGWLEWEYFVRHYRKMHPEDSSAAPPTADHCSAFVATGSYTKDGRPVIAHNNWSSYIEGERWVIIFDIAPEHGHRILMDGLPGIIASDDDFGVNGAGIMITETTISRFEGYDPAGIPEFVRARKAMQYASSIGDFARIMEDGNNGGYANTWLVADAKTGQIGSLELGLKNVSFKYTSDGYYIGSNFPDNTNLIRQETTYDPSDSLTSECARRVRWEQLMAQHKGAIDVAAAESFLADHYDVRLGRIEPSERTLCGHVDLSPRGMGDWQTPFGPAGAVQNKVADASMALRMSFAAAAGHACGQSFDHERFLQEHPQYSWQEKYLRDMPSEPWTVFSSAK